MKLKKDTEQVIKKSILTPCFADPEGNANLALKEYEQGFTQLSTLPLVVTFALTTHCYKEKPCVICDRNSRPSSADSEVDEEMIKAVKPLLKTASIVLLHCGGEAMFSPYFDEVIGSINAPTKVVFATNGMALTQNRADLMLGSGAMGDIVISLDAATPEVYRIMRPSCDFNLVKRNLKYYSDRGSEFFGESTPGFILNMTLCEANIKDVPQFVDLAYELGAFGITLNHLNSGLTHKVTTSEGWIWNYREQKNFKSKKQHDNLILEAYQRALDYGIKMAFVGEPLLSEEIREKNHDVRDSLRDFSWRPSEPTKKLWYSPAHKALHPGLKPCLKAWQEIIIQPNGNIRRCYFHDETQWTVGNILDADFMEIWNSEEMIKFREEFYNKSMSNICIASSPCLYRGRQ